MPFPTRTANTGRRYVLTYRDDPKGERAWDVYGPFGRRHSVWERERLGTLPPTDMSAIMADAQKAGRRLWCRLVTVRYLAD